MGVDLESMANDVRAKALYSEFKDEQALVPIYIALDMPSMQLREAFLWKLNDPHWTPTTAAVRLRQELGLPQGYEKLLADQITSGLHRYQGYDAGEEEQLVDIDLEVEVKGDHGLQTFRDRFQWDLSQKQNVLENYAYAVCSDCGLGMINVETIVNALRKKLGDTEAALQTCAELKRNVLTP